MTAASIARAANDEQLKARVQAMASREILFDAELAATTYGQDVAGGFPNLAKLMWPVAVDTEAAYETAVNSGRGAPGHDADIITDAAIAAAVAAHWPYTSAEVDARLPYSTWVVAGMQGQVTVAQGTPSAPYTVQWGDGGGAGALGLDASGEAFAGHDYAGAGSYVVVVNDENGDPIKGGMTLVVP